MSNPSRIRDGALAENISSFVIYCVTVRLAFSSSDTVVWRQNGHPACKRTECWCVDGGDLTGALYILQFWLSPTLPLRSLAAAKS